jgi:predicted AAA+ superfamily ATPase
LFVKISDNFTENTERVDKGALWEMACYRALVDQYGLDAVYYWRTADGQEVDFVLPEIEYPFAMEAKYDEAFIKVSKYKKFTETYPEMPLRFAWLNHLNEDFFRRLNFSGTGRG